MVCFWALKSIVILSALTSFILSSLPNSGAQLARAGAVLELRKLGFTTVSAEDEKALNRALLSSDNPNLIFEADTKTRLDFIGDKMLAISYTRTSDGHLAMGMPQYLYAIFIDTTDMKVRHLEHWPMQPRRNREGLDSEGRIFSLEGGSFAVLADNRVRLYSSTFELLREVPLQNEGKDLWAAEIAPGGKYLFLRHEHLGTVEYLWLSSHTLDIIRRERAPTKTSVDVRGPATVSDDAIFVAQGGDRLEAVFPSKAPSIACDVKACWHSTDMIALSEGRMALAGGSGVAVYSQDGACLWSLEVSGARAPAAITRSSLDGKRFALEISGSDTHFAGIKLGKDPTFFVFDLGKSEPLLIARAPLTPSFTFALDPHGSQLAILSGTSLSLYGLKK